MLKSFLQLFVWKKIMQKNCGNLQIFSYAMQHLARYTLSNFEHLKINFHNPMSSNAWLSVGVLARCVQLIYVVESLANTSSMSSDITVICEERDMVDEQRLMRDLQWDYSTAARPVFNASHTVTVKLGLTLTQISKVVSNAA